MDTYMNDIKVSVILPVFNAEKTLKTAIDSILEQTYKNFELIIINDGSNDLSEAIIKEYKDHRLKYFINEVNKGLIYTLNKAVSLCKGEYIARMDSDDISAKNRLETQVRYLTLHPDILAVGTARSIFGENVKRKIQCFPENFDDIKAYMFLACPIVHPSVMMRRDVFFKYNIRYDEHYRNMEDYKLWYDIMQIGKIANISEPLLFYRISKEQVSTKNKVNQMIGNKLFRREIMSTYLLSKGINIDERIINWELIHEISHLKLQTIDDAKMIASILFVCCLSVHDNKGLGLIKFLYSLVWTKRFFHCKYIGGIIIHYLHLKRLDYLSI